MTRAGFFERGISPDCSAMDLFYHIKLEWYNSTAMKETDRPTEEPGVIYTKDTWARSYMEANTEWPQSAKVITLRVTANVLADPPENWVDFLHSQFSPLQLVNIATTMDALHRTSNIQFYTSHTSWGQRHIAQGRGARIITDDRLQQLWQRAKLGVLNSLEMSIDPKAPPLPEEEDLNDKSKQIIVPDESTARKIQEALTDPAKMEILRQAGQVITDYMESTEGKILSQLHRDLQTDAVRDARTSTRNLSIVDVDPNRLKDAIKYHGKKAFEKVFIGKMAKNLEGFSLGLNYSPRLFGLVLYDFSWRKLRLNTLEELWAMQARWKREMAVATGKK